MSDPLQTAQAIEPDPIPSNLRASAPIKGDLERGYVNDQGIYSDAPLRENEDGQRISAAGEEDRERGRGRASQLRKEEGGSSRRASPSASASAVAGSRCQSRAGLTRKEEKAHGSGLTEGDEGESRTELTRLDST
jgi:hypothetical protein